MYTYARPQNLAYPARVLSDEGALSRSDSEIGQSASWPAPGRPGTVDGLVAEVERREVPRPTSLGARGWRYQLRKAGPLLRLRGASQASWRLPPLHPLARCARDWQTSDALRRENTEAWLFESSNRKFE